MFCLAFSISWNPKEVGFSDGERMELLVRQTRSGKEKKLPSSMPLYRLPAEGMTQTKAVLSCLKSELKMCVSLPQRPTLEVDSPK